MTQAAMFMVFLISVATGLHTHTQEEEQMAEMTSNGKLLSSGGWSYRRRRSVSSSPSPPPSQTQSIDFGGNLHTTDSLGRLVRPEFAKSQICTTTKCEDCDSKTGSGCWNGASTGLYDWMQVSVNKNDNKDHYAYEVFASCGANSGSWKVMPKELDNADLSLYLDGAFVKTLPDPGCTSNCETKFGQSTSLNLGAGQKARIRIVLKRKDSKKAARAKVAIQGNDMTQDVDSCMSQTECLSKLGDNSAESFALRNSNVKQRDCLTGSSRSTECTKWKACLTDEQKNKLLAFLKASLRSSSLQEARVVKRSRKTNQVTCMDPSSADPESWECECIDWITQKCGGADETCFFNTMCAQAEICSEWKTDNGCPGSFLDKNTPIMRRAIARGENSSLMDTGADSTLQGKCAE